MKNLSKSLALAFVLGHTALSFGQQITYKSQPNENGFIRCHAMEMDSVLRMNNPQMPSMEAEELWLQSKIEEYKQQNPSNQKATLLNIPVVVHVIHDGDNVGSGENISDAQVISQIDVLNEDYRKMMGTRGHNTHPDGADIEIVFCLATKDPSGAATDGIDRVDYGVSSFTSEGAIETMKTNTTWNSNNYMNMWTVKMGGFMSSILGYAQFPNSSGLSGINTNNGSANTDGVVAGYQYFGSNDKAGGIFQAPYNKGRTMTHEVGHFLGLRHIWGDSNCGNDFCNDTPQQQGDNFGCPTSTTCDGAQDMVENYMDYTDDDCMNIFTEDQKTRIRTVLSVSPRRASLTTSDACSILDVNELSNEHFKVYPNPSAGEFNIQLLDFVSGTKDVIVSDLSGRIVMEMINFNENTFVVNLDDAKNGTYILTVRTGDVTISERIVLKK